MVWATLIAYLDGMDRTHHSHGPIKYMHTYRWFLKDVHCDPDEALHIHQDLKSKQSLAIHWGTFPLSDEDAVEPALELARCRKELNISVDEFFTMAHGETLFFGDKPAHDFASLRPDMLETYIKYFMDLAAKDVVQKKKELTILGTALR